MSVALSSAEQRHLALLSETLLSPLAGPDPAAWRERVDTGLRAAFGCDHVMFVTPEEGRVVFRSPTIDREVLDVFAELTTPDPGTGLFASRDPVVETWFRARRADRLEVFTETVNDHLLRQFGHDMRRSEIANTVWRGGMLDFFGLMTECDGQEMMLITGFERRGRARLDDESIRRALQMVLPSFRAGHHALVTHHARRDALAGTLDFMRDALLLVDAAGRELHRNTALAQLLDTDPERERLLAACRTTAFSAGRAKRLVLSGRDDAVDQVVHTAAGRYLVRGVPAPASMFDDIGAVLVSIAPAAPAALDDASLRARFCLTAREIEVAHHLASGLSNAELAAALGTSAYTARNHVEKVLWKLGVSSRTRVGAVLRGEVVGDLLA